MYTNFYNSRRNANTPVIPVLPGSTGSQAPAIPVLPPLPGRSSSSLASQDPYATMQSRDQRRERSPDYSRSPYDGSEMFSFGSAPTTLSRREHGFSFGSAPMKNEEEEVPRRVWGARPGRKEEEEKPTRDWLLPAGSLSLDSEIRAKAAQERHNAMEKEKLRTAQQQERPRASTMARGAAEEVSMVRYNKPKPESVETMQLASNPYMTAFVDDRVAMALENYQKTSAPQISAMVKAQIALANRDLCARLGLVDPGPAIDDAPGLSGTESDQDDTPPGVGPDAVKAKRGRPWGAARIARETAKAAEAAEATLAAEAAEFAKTPEGIEAARLMEVARAAEYAASAEGIAAVKAAKAADKARRSAIAAAEYKEMEAKLKVALDRANEIDDESD